MYIKRKKLKTVLKSLKQGASIVNACRSANINTCTFWKWRRALPKLDKIVIETIEARTQVVIDALYKNALDGNTAAQIFWLKNRAGWKDVVEQIGGGTNVYVTPQRTIVFTDIEDVDNASNGRTKDIHAEEGKTCNRLTDKI